MLSTPTNNPDTTAATMSTKNHQPILTAAIIAKLSGIAIATSALTLDSGSAVLLLNAKVKPRAPNAAKLTTAVVLYDFI